MSVEHEENNFVVDHSEKSILARGCDPIASLMASKSIPGLIGNPEYTPVTDDEEFIEQLKTRNWSVVFFAPGACRFSAAKMPIPGASNSTHGWTLKQYRDLIKKYQDHNIQIVESLDEGNTIRLLKAALDKAT